MRIFCWSDKRKWLKETVKYGQLTLTDSVRQCLIRRPPDGCWSDDLSWFPRANAELELTDAFCGYYSHVRAYHACRPIDVGSYFLHGLVGQRPDLIVSSFKSMFADVDGDLLGQAIDAMSHRSGNETGKIFFSCNRDHLVEDCGHYLIQGSEYIMGLAARLCQFHPDNEDYRLRLRKFGIPTVFGVDIPVDYIPDLQLQSLMKSIIAEWAYLFLPDDDHAEDEMGFVLHRDLEPEHISSHSHPNKIRDPHFPNQLFMNSLTWCEFCASDKRHYR